MRVLVVGAGRWGTNLILRFDKLLGIGNVFIAEQDTSKWHNWEPAPGLRCYASLSAGLANIPGLDAVVIATPPKSHYELALATLKAGKHVLVEKPMALNGAEAQHLCVLAAARGLVCQTDSTWEHHEGAMAVCEPLEHAVFTAFWFNPPYKVTSEDVLWTNGPHPIALMLRFFRGQIPKILHSSTNFNDAYVLFDFGAAGSAVVSVSWQTNQKERVIVAAGSHLGQRFIRTYVDSAYPPPKKDALTAMCEAFVGRAQQAINGGAAWQDSIGLSTVEVLEMIGADQPKILIAVPPIRPVTI